MAEGSNLGLPVRFTDTAAAAVYAQDNEDRHVYFNTCLMLPPPKGGRGGNNHAAVMTALYADLDCCEGHHAGIKPSRAEVLDMIGSGDVLPKPTLLVDSGGGYHAYWVFDQPLELVGDNKVLAEDLLRGLNTQLARWHEAKGYKYERLKDLARILRPVGTFNHKKGDHKRVQSVWLTEDRFDPKKLPFAEAEAVTKQADVSSFDQLEALNEATLNCATIDAQWNNDASGYVIKCMAVCVSYGCSKGTAIQVVRTMESRVGPFPITWSDEDLGKRYDDALKQGNLGENADKLLLNEAELMTKLASRLKGRAFWVRKWKKWVVWDGQRFVEDEMSIFYDEARAMLAELKSRAITLTDARQIKKLTALHDTYNSLKGLTSLAGLAKWWMGCEFDHFNKQRDLFHCSNGVIKLGEKSEFIPPDASYLNTTINDIAYDPDARCPRWEKFIEEIMDNDPEMCRYMQKLCGYCLSGRTDFEALWVLLGEGGNGKSKFVKILQQVLGGYSATIRSQLLTAGRKEHPTEIADLFQKRGVMASETSQDAKLSEEQVKALTGNDKLKARRMQENFWEFVPTHKLFLVTNNLPVIKSTDIGIWRRVNVIPFDVSFVECADYDLERKLMAELPGILNWMVKGFEMYATGGLETPERVLYAGQEYKNDMDTCGRFLGEWCERDPEAVEVGQYLMQAYTLWSDQNGFQKPSRYKFDQDLVRHGIKTGGGPTTHSPIRKNGMRVKVGVRLAKHKIPPELLAGLDFGFDDE